jgi:hypothetical protein
MNLNKIAIIISVFSFFAAYFVNELNITVLEGDSIELREGQTVKTADDLSYLKPAISLAETGTYKDSFPGLGAYFLRPPGYPAFLAALLVIFDKPDALHALKFIQLGLFALSVYCLFFIALNYLKSTKWASAIAAFYGLSNIASGFVYYTLSEGISAPLVLFYVFYLVKAKNETLAKSKLTYYVIAAVLFSFLFITRPVLGILGLSIPIFLFIDYSFNTSLLLKRIVLIGAIASAPMFMWQVRNMIIAKEVVGLHPIYYPENSTSCFRPTHEAFWEFCKSWGEIGSHFHSYVVPFWDATINGDTAQIYIDNIIKELPTHVVTHFGEQRLHAVLTTYQHSILLQKAFYDKGIAMPTTIPAIELKAISEIDKLTTEYRSAFWFNYAILAPLKVFKTVAFHSNLSLYFYYKKPFNESFLLKAYMFGVYLIHTFAFVVFAFGLFSNKQQNLKIALLLPVALYVFYLIYFQRGIEERYTLPVLAIVLLSAAQIVQECFGNFYSFRRRNS